MTRRTDRAETRLEHIVLGIERIAGYSADMSEADFAKNQLVQDAVLWNLTIIGEAAAVILSSYQDFAAAYPDLPLRKARGMRNQIAHGYDLVDIQIVWRVLRRDLPPLHAAGRDILRNLGEPSP